MEDRPYRPRPPVAGVLTVHHPADPGHAAANARALAAQCDWVIVVDDGGGGEVVHLLRQGNQHDRIRCLGDGTNHGSAAALNTGMSEAERCGAHWAFLLDQDSTLLDGAVDAQLRASRLGTEVPALVGAVLGRPAAALDQGSPKPLNPVDAITSGSLLRVDAWRTVGGFDEDLFIDWVDVDLAIRLSSRGEALVRSIAPVIVHQAGEPTPAKLPLLPRFDPSNHPPTRHYYRARNTVVLARRWGPRYPSWAWTLVERELRGLVKVVLAEKQRTRKLAAAVQGARDGLRRRPRLGKWSRASTNRKRLCRYCGAPTRLLHSAVRDRLFGVPGSWNINRCMACRALVLDYDPADEELAGWYVHYYTHEVGARTVERPWGRLWPLPGRRHELRQMDRLFAPPIAGRVLDVGCGDGGHLCTLQADGWQVVGQDVDPAAGKALVGVGGKVFIGELEDLDEAPESFHLISFNHVLEHAPDPVALLRTARRFLRPDGTLVVIGPNPDSVLHRLLGSHWRGLEPPRHLAIPTAASLGRVAPACGLRTRDARTSVAHAATFAGGSVSQVVSGGRSGRLTALLAALVGQTICRAVSWVRPTVGEELVWIGVHDGAPLPDAKSR